MATAFCPFVVLTDGRIDYGTDHADDIRHIPTDIRDRPVRLGEVMTTRERDDDGQIKPWIYSCIGLDAV